MSSGIASMAAEIEQLKHDIERYIKIAGELATDNERLRALVQQHDDEVWVGLERAKDVRAATIEECARVADYHSAWDKTNVPVGQNIAAAIRALKDKP